MRVFLNRWRRKLKTLIMAPNFGSVLCIVSCLYIVEPAFGTQQIPNELVFGNRKYFIEEIPMLGLWDYGRGDPAEGKEKPPKFEAANSANWVGYQAQFEIRNSKLWLKKITGKIDGKRQTNEQIIPGEDFPKVAKWFSGRIHLEVGDFDDGTQEATSVIIFHIKNGVVTKTEYTERMKRVATWNGLPEADEEEPSQ